MKSLLSFRILIIFAERLCKAIFPAMIILLICSWWNRKQFVRKSAFWFLSIAMLLTFSIRFLFYLMGYSRYSNRYLYTLVVMLCVFATPGFFRLVEYIALKKRWKKQSVMTGVLVVVILGSVGKGINHKDEKAYLRHMGQRVKELCGKVDRSLICDARDYHRLSYYAGTMDAYSCKSSEPKKLVEIAAVKKLDGRVFVFMSKNDDDFRKVFANENIDFTFELVGSFKDYKGRPYSLYEYKP